MTDTIDMARAHYNATGLTARIKNALLKIAPETAQLKISDIAALDQFHTRGMLATRDLAAMTLIGPETRVLDLGCGIGGPARFLAATFGCHVTGMDLSETFIEAARYLTERCAMQDKVSFQVGNALETGLASGSFDLVFLQHVAMNIGDRASLYAEIARVLAPGGRLATYDVILKSGDVHYPTPWARDAAASVLLTEDQTRDALLAASLEPVAWRDDSELAAAWFATLPTNPPTDGPTLALVLGPDFPTRTSNLGRNIKEGRVGILSAIATRAGS
jgi:ubiquinone/menaquinone biosynthesis C-methylase UbiE